MCNLQLIINLKRNIIFFFLSFFFLFSQQSRLGHMTTNAIDDEMMRKVTQEWEFFYPIHGFMSRKITNLHSYALTQGEGKQKLTNYQKEQNENNSSLASHMNTKTASALTAVTMTLTNSIVPSPEIKAGQNVATLNSDTNNDYATTETISSVVRSNDSQETHCTTTTTTCESEAETRTHALEDDIQSSSSTAAKTIPNTDHDFYSKKSPKPTKWTNCNDKLNNAIESEIKTEISDDNNTQTDKEKGLNDKNSTNIIEQQEHDLVQENIRTTLNNNRIEENPLNHLNYGATCSSNAKSTIMVMIPKEEPKGADTEQRHEKRKRNERDNYYRHKRRFNRRLERRFDALLNVFGQIVRAEYPSVDVSPLFGATATTNGPQQSGLFGGATFSSDEFSEAEISTSNDELMESQGESTMGEE